MPKLFSFKEITAVKPAVNCIRIKIHDIHVD